MDQVNKFELLDLSQKISPGVICEDFSFHDVDEDTFRVYISPFDELKDAIERLISFEDRIICLNSIAILEIHELCKQIIRGRCVNIEFIIVIYSNFEQARLNTVNFNPIFEQIDHLSSFMIAQKFDQYRRSLSAIIEYITNGELFYDGLLSGEISKEEYSSIIHERMRIKILKIT